LSIRDLPRCLSDIQHTNCSTSKEKHMKLPTHFAKALAAGAISTLVVFPAHAGSSEDAMAAALRQIQSLDANAEWHNVWMPQASAHAVAPTVLGDRLLAEVVAGYSRPILDRGGWENKLMTNSEYTAANPLLAAGVDSGAISGG
jgi:hypothetical protein